jgi:hypothetical protein
MRPAVHRILQGNEVLHDLVGFSVVAFSSLRGMMIHS